MKNDLKPLIIVSIVIVAVVAVLIYLGANNSTPPSIAPSEGEASPSDIALITKALDIIANAQKQNQKSTLSSENKGNETFTNSGRRFGNQKFRSTLKKIRGKIPV